MISELSHPNSSGSLDWEKKLLEQALNELSSVAKERDDALSSLHLMEWKIHELEAMKEADAGLWPINNKMKDLETFSHSGDMNLVSDTERSSPSAPSSQKKDQGTVKMESSSESSNHVIALTDKLQKTEAQLEIESRKFQELLHQKEKIETIYEESAKVHDESVKSLKEHIRQLGVKNKSLEDEMNQHKINSQEKLNQQNALIKALQNSYDECKTEANSYLNRAESSEKLLAATIADSEMKYQHLVEESRIQSEAMKEEHMISMSKVQLDANNLSNEVNALVSI